MENQPFDLAVEVNDSEEIESDEEEISHVTATSSTSTDPAVERTAAVAEGSYTVGLIVYQVCRF